MKCQFCGTNLGLEDELCPHCGKPNSEAASHVAVMNSYKEDFDRTQKKSVKKSRFNNRVARIVVIVIMVIIVYVMKAVTVRYSDFDIREERNTQKKAQALEDNRGIVLATLKQMELNREYLAMEYYVAENRIRGAEGFDDYFRVFTAAIDYEVIYSDLLSIVDGFDYYGEKTKKDWCYDIAIYVSGYHLYTEGEFWHDPADSPMHAGEHGAFIADAKKDIQDMLQVYFKLTDKEAASMWDMEEEELGALLYEHCQEIYPEVNAHE